MGVIILVMTGRLRLLKFERIVLSTKRCIDHGGSLATPEKCGFEKNISVTAIFIYEEIFNGRYSFYCWNSNSFD